MTAAPSRRRLALLVLAAGKGTRLATSDDAPPKVLVECLGYPLLEHVRRSLVPLGADETVVMVGHAAERVEAWLEKSWPEATVVRQIPQNGTGHAVRLGLDAIPDFEGDVLVVYGDVPQLTADDLQALRDRHASTGAKATVLTGVIDAPGGLGRIVRDAGGRFKAIVEAKDASNRPEILGIKEFNTGIYAFDAAALRPAVKDLSKENAQGEEYATDAVGRIAASDGHVEAIATPNGAHLLGVNDQSDLATTTALLRRRVTSAHMAAGVTIVDPDTTVIELDVTLEPGARILPFTYIQKGCSVAAGAVVGPFARLRGGARLEAGAEIGNFVEVKNSTLGPGAKAKHLTYLGDATVGPKANIGCGTITANYDGKNKHRTDIGAGARIGSGSVLIAPVKIGAGAITGANAVVIARRDVPDGATVVGIPARSLRKGPPASTEKPGEDAPAGTEQERRGS
ncbi:MAG: bifunctional N-acetylglucosamine-1-phosphate uridyltransferase/glucosamine-1-phosphate acetyltransferase [bacterium]|nr:bifunctional N-acetylglucosamine-1-phosphate uridyltransferase/glucosamine-1-phosphate acetyltransferase [bacterium]